MIQTCSKIEDILKGFSLVDFKDLCNTVTVEMISLLVHMRKEILTNNKPSITFLFASISDTNDVNEYPFDYEQECDSYHAFISNIMSSMINEGDLLNDVRDWTFLPWAYENLVNVYLDFLFRQKEDRKIYSHIKFEELFHIVDKFL
jgi:hypothetical protein